MQSTRFMNTSGAAELLGLTPAGVRYLVEVGELTVERLGPRTWVFDRSEVEQLAASRAEAKRVVREVSA